MVFTALSPSKKNFSLTNCFQIQKKVFQNAGNAELINVNTNKTYYFIGNVPLSTLTYA